MPNSNWSNSSAPVSATAQITDLVPGTTAGWVAGTALSATTGVFSGLLTAGAGLAVTGAATFSSSVSATSFTDGYTTFTFAQINRAGAAIELQYAGGAGSLVRVGGSGSNPITLNANTGSVSMGALTATDITVNTIGTVARSISVLGSPNEGTYMGYLLLAKAYVSGLQAASLCQGTFTLDRGSVSSGNRLDVFTVNSHSAYNGQNFSVSGHQGGGYFNRLVTVTYAGTVYHAIETVSAGGGPDNGVRFTGSSYNCSPIYVDATYVSAVTAFTDTTPFYISGAVSMGALTATTGTFSGAVSMGALTATYQNTSNTVSTDGQSVWDINAGSMGAYSRIKFANAQLGGQTLGLAYLQWYRGGSQDRTFSVFTSNTAGTSTEAFKLDGTNGGAATFASSVSMGALTATTGTFSGLLTMNAGGSLAANYGLAIADGAPGATTGKLYSIATNSLQWSGSTVLTIGNAGANAATLLAAVSAATAPYVGTNAQMTAFTPPAGTTPYWYATDVTETDGNLGKLYHWTGSWTAVGTPQVTAGRVVAGNISAGAIGAQALAASITTTGILQSTGAAVGTSTTPPTGFYLKGTPYTATCLNDVYGNAVTLSNCVMELGGQVNFGGYPLTTLAVAKLANGGSILYGTGGTYTWICPTGITQVEVLIVGGGGGNSDGSTGDKAGGAGGGCIRALLQVNPGTSYTVTVGAGGAGSTTAAGTTGGTSSLVGPAAGSAPAVNITATGGTGGNQVGPTGGAGGNATINGNTVATGTAGSTATANATNPAIVSGIIFASAVGGGGGGAQTGTYYNGGYTAGFAPTAGQVGGGGSGFGVGGGNSAALNWGGGSYPAGNFGGGGGYTSGSTKYAYQGANGCVLLRW